MGDIARDSDEIEIDGPPPFEHGERVVSRFMVRNDGTFPGREVGDLLVSKGDVGIVVSIGTFLQQFYIFGVDFPDRGYRVGMKSREIVSIDRLPEPVAQALGPQRVAALRRIGHA